MFIWLLKNAQMQGVRNPLQGTVLNRSLQRTP